MRKEVRFSIEGSGEAVVKVSGNDKAPWVRTYADGFGFQEWGVLEERTGELITSGNDITTNYLRVASQLALKHLGYHVKVSKTSPCHRAIGILTE